MQVFHTHFPGVLCHFGASLFILDAELVLVPLIPKPAPLACSTLLHNISMLHVSSSHSFSDPPFSPACLFILPLARSLCPASSNPGVLWFPRTLWFPQLVWGIEKAMANVCKNAHKIPSTGVSIICFTKCLTKLSPRPERRQNIIIAAEVVAFAVVTAASNCCL